MVLRGVFLDWDLLEECFSGVWFWWEKNEVYEAGIEARCVSVRWKWLQVRFSSSSSSFRFPRILFSLFLCCLDGWYSEEE